MSDFPKLRTGVVAQYPATRELRFSTTVKNFLDGSEQRYRDLRVGQRRWVISLSQLDESELAELTDFFEQRQDRFETFDFEDPWTGTAVSGCRLLLDHMEARVDGEFDNRTQLIVVAPAV